MTNIRAQASPPQSGKSSGVFPSPVAILSQVKCPVALSDLGGKYLWMNGEALALFGFASWEEAVRGFSSEPPWVELTRPDGSLLPRADWPERRAARGETVNGWELQGQRLDTGHRFAASYSVSPVPDLGEGALFLTTLRETKESERAQRWTRGAFEQIRDLVLVIEAVRGPDGGPVDWVYREANAGALELLQFHRDQVIGHRCSALLPDRFARVHAFWCRVLATGEPWNYEQRFKERVYWVSVFRIDPDTLGTASVDITDRKQGELALQRASEILNMALAAASMGTWSTLPGEPMVWSARSRELLGLDGLQEVATLEDFLALIHPDDRQMIEVTFARVLSASGAGSSESVRCRRVLSDGTCRWLSTSAKSLFVEEGGLRHLVLLAGTLMDVTEEVEGAARLCADKERLAVTLRSIGDGVIATDADGKIVLINGAAEELTGFHSAEAVGRPIGEVFRIVNEDTRLPEENPVNRVLKEGCMVGLANHTALLAKNGAEHPIADSGAPILDGEGRIGGAVLVFRDQSEERKAEQVLLRSRSELRSLIQQLPVGILIERDGIIIYVNPALCGYLGYLEASELVGKSLEQFRAGKGGPDRQAAIPGSGTNRVPSREWRMLRSDGSVVALESSPGRELEFLGAQGTLHVLQDLSELRQVQAQLMQADRLASVGTLAAGVAHEINNPLAYLVAAIEFIGEELNASQASGLAPKRMELERAVAEAREGAARVRHIVRDLKTFSRVDAEHRTRVALDQVIESSLRMLSNEIRHRARVVKVYGNAPRVLANEARLGQVFLNILLNAAQAIPEGHCQENEIRVEIRSDERGWAVVDVSDTGSGVPAAVAEHIFEPFFTTKQVGVGTGLGLSVCLNIVTALGGELSLADRPEGGTVFRVALPGTHGTSDSEALRGDCPRPEEGRRGRILVIDDEPSVGNALRRMLAKEHDVEVFSSGTPALARIREGALFDVILCDLMMPDLTGWELYADLLNGMPSQAERMVFITGGVFTPRAAQFLDEVPNPRIEKPFVPTELRAFIRRLVV